MASTKYVKNKIEKVTGKGMKSNREGQEEVYELWVKYEGWVISVMSQDEKAISIHTRRVSDEPNAVIGYHPGTYWDNITQALKKFNA